ncbi:hypothetical protein SDC9_205009 [bioreactor metagenome]|uniref:Uncharacterized protein n=1 Tax=bioreactor metagenome TaxID=1076179 RepID=A0A645J0U7_9ZZZZ
MVPVQNSVFKYAKHLFGQRNFINTIVVIQPGLRTPADVHGGIDVCEGPGHNFAQFIPVVHFIKRHGFNWSAGDNQAVKALIFDFIESFIEF